MIIEYLYPVMIIVCLAFGIALLIACHFWFKHLFWNTVHRIDKLSDRGIFWIIDKIMGCKGKVIMKDTEALNVK